MNTDLNSIMIAQYWRGRGSVNVWGSRGEVKRRKVSFSLVASQKIVPNCENSRAHTLSVLFRDRGKYKKI